MSELVAHSKRSVAAPPAAAAVATTTGASDPAAATNAAAANGTANATPIPSDVTARNALRLSISLDKPIVMDYWLPSLNKTASVGVREGGEKMLVKSAEEYTSSIAKMYRADNEFIVITENSIYIVSKEIPTRRIA